MAAIQIEDKTIVNPKEIMKHLEQFYSELYQKDESVVFDVSHLKNIPQVPENMTPGLIGHISKTEIETAIKNMAKNKTPGGDGLPVEWYIVFWLQISDILLEAINAGYDTGRLHGTALEGIITLIPKKDRDTQKIENMRPITLLNVDYKLIEKVLADRIKPTLYSIINSNQKGFYEK